MVERGISNTETLSSDLPLQARGDSKEKLPLRLKLVAVIIEIISNPREVTKDSESRDAG